ncbi:zinc ribbon domain-containing protein [bacterium]|nr:zinc ribbon domain-containing protein [bacterium]
MPLFEFECNNCKHRFEELVTSSSKRVEKCPECEDTGIRKLVSAGSIKPNGSASSLGSYQAPSCSSGGG